MIIDKPDLQYIYIFSKKCFDSPSDPASYLTYQDRRLTNKEYLEHWGKWVFLAEREQLDELARKFDPYVEVGTLPCIKYDHAPQQWAGKEQCGMCVYCDDRQREEVWQLISSFGVSEKRWVYERDLIEKWLPGGEHLERWITVHGLTDEEAEKLREEAHHKYQAAFFERPNDICLGWAQLDATEE